VEDDPKKYQAWWNTYRQTPAGKTWESAYEEYNKIMRESPYITATVDRQGVFRIDDVPEGNYVLGVRFSKHSAGSLANHHFSVPPVEAGGNPEPVDLGTLTLQK
jgi:hypothetical protein